MHPEEDSGSETAGRDTPVWYPTWSNRSWAEQRRVCASSRREQSRCARVCSEIWRFHSAVRLSCGWEDAFGTQGWRAVDQD